MSGALASTQYAFRIFKFCHNLPSKENICENVQISSQNHAAACAKKNFCFRERHKWACQEKHCFLGIISHLRFCTL